MCNPNTSECASEGGTDPTHNRGGDIDVSGPRREERREGDRDRDVIDTPSSSRHTNRQDGVGVYIAFRGNEEGDACGRRYDIDKDTGQREKKTGKQEGTG